MKKKHPFICFSLDTDLNHGNFGQPVYHCHYCKEQAPETSTQQFVHLQHGYRRLSHAIVHSHLLLLQARSCIQILLLGMDAVLFDSIPHW